MTVMTDEDTHNAKIPCNAPCVINVSNGYYLVSCQREHGHESSHIHKAVDNAGIAVTILWDYTGDVGASEISPAPSLNKRCRTWVHVSGMKKFGEKGSGLMDDPSFTIEQEPAEGGFCCENEPEHKGRHMRSGEFKPLGVHWEMMW